MHRYELFRMQSRERETRRGLERALPTTKRGLGFVGTRKPLTTRPGPFRTALHVRIDAVDEAAKASLLAFASETAPMDLALVTPESTIYVDGAQVLWSRDALVLAVSGGLYDEPGDARAEWRASFEQLRVAESVTARVSSKPSLRGKLFRR
jgi:hypothetical protein